MAIGPSDLLVISFIGFLGMIIPVIFFWRIFSKMGYSGVISLLLFIPLINFIVIGVLACSEWPIERELKQALNRQTKNN